MVRLGVDSSGVTSESLQMLWRHIEGRTLSSIDISADDGKGNLMVFYFDDDSFYIASGFSIGYKGEGPRGLLKAIRTWHPDAISEEIGNTEIPKLDRNFHYIWKPDTGFIKVGKASYEEEDS